MANTKHLSASKRGSEQQSDDGRYSIRYSDKLNAVSEYEIELLMGSLDQLKILIEAIEADEAIQRGLQN